MPYIGKGYPTKSPIEEMKAAKKFAQQMLDGTITSKKIPDFTKPSGNPIEIKFQNPKTVLQDLKHEMPAHSKPTPIKSQQTPRNRIPGTREYDSRVYNERMNKQEIARQRELAKQRAESLQESLTKIRAEAAKRAMEHINNIEL